MPTKNAPAPSPRWPSLRYGLLLGAAVALACLALFVLRRGKPAQPSAPGASSSPAAHAHGSHRRADPAARPHAGISGHVLDRDGKPVQSAQVCTWAMMEHAVVTAQAAPRCAKVDDAGAYALGDLLPATPLTISAFAPRFAPVGYHDPKGAAAIRLVEGEQRTGVDLVLGHAGVPLQGSVSDVTGGAVSGALVVSEDGPNRSVTVSDAKGAFTLWVQPGHTSVEATAAGYAAGSAYGTAPTHFFAIHLVPGGTLVGRTVIAGKDEPVADVFVEGIQVEGSWMRASARTDEEGRFRIDGLLPGRYRVEATSEGREGYSKVSTTIAMGETSSEVLVELDPAYLVKGRVVDKATGEPCKGGQVTITDRKQNEYSQAAIDPDGWARMPSVIPGTYRVQVSCQDHVPRDDYPQVIVADKDMAPLTWQVDAGARVVVEVVDSEGRPVTKGTVYANGMGPDLPFGYAEHPEADGTFHVGGLKAGEYNISVRISEGGEARKTITTSLDREEHVRIELPAAGVIDGVVEDADHRPVAGVRVFASGPGRDFTISADDGTFSLAGLSPGDYEVNVQEMRQPGEPKDDHTAKATVAAGEHAKVTLTVEARSGVIQGRVIDGTGAPVTDAFIDFSSGGMGALVPRYDSGHAPIVTDTDGHFTIEGLADGDYGVRASRKGGNEAVADHVKPGTRDLVIKLEAGGSIAGTLSANGAPIERFYVTARSAAGSFYREELFFHAGGEFMVHDLPAGSYKLVADTPLGHATADVTLAEGEQKSGVALVLALRGTVEGRLVPAEGGAPIGGMVLGVNGNSDVVIMTGNGREAVSGPDGSFHLEGVLPGSWTLTAYSREPGFGPVNVPIVVQDGGGTTDVGDVQVPRAPAPEP